MGCCELRLRLLGLIALTALNIMTAEAVVKRDDVQVRNFTEQLLQAIPEGDGAASVERLVLSGNNITLDEGDGKSLATYPGLVVLQLDGNQVTHIPAKFFSVTPKLRVLSLTGNQLSSLDPESLSGLDALSVLDLSHNRLTSVPPQLFSALKNLKEVSLQGNPWNCSCPLLSSIAELKAAGVAIGPNTTCAAAEGRAGRDLSEAVAQCHPSLKPMSATPNPQPAEMKLGLQPYTSTTSPKPTPTLEQNRASGERAPVLGNTWKFTACIAALAAFTSMLIVGAIKGPSWYKMLHNYRHKRLSDKPDEEEDGDIVSTVFSETEGQMSQRTFVFETDAQVVEAEEAEDDYFEDPYIRREE